MQKYELKTRLALYQLSHPAPVKKM